MQLCSVYQFVERLDETEERPLRAVTLELTRRCNLNCLHCFCGQPPNHKSRQDELAFSEWERILEQCAQEGVLFLTLTGGEPLLYPQFREIWKIAKQKGFLITLFSNGTLIDDDMADFLAEWTPLEVSMSLYGASEETYQKVTGGKGMFQRVVDGFERLARRKINMEVKGVFSRLNVHDFEAVKAIALKYCDTFRWDAELMGAFPGCKNKPAEIRLSVDDYFVLEQSDPALRHVVDEKSINWEPPRRAEQSAFRCGVGRGSVHIDAYGGMHPCLPLESLKYDLLSGSVREGWRQAVPNLLRDLAWQPGPCQVCDAAEICCSCTAFAMLENCSPTGPVPYRCALASIRAQASGLTECLQAIPESFRNYLQSSKEENM